VSSAAVAVLSTATSVTLVVAAFFALLALIAFARWLLAREQGPARYRRFRVGLFVERDRELEEPDER
jgi:hypothetical protein